MADLRRERETDAGECSGDLESRKPNRNRKISGKAIFADKNDSSKSC